LIAGFSNEDFVWFTGNGPSGRSIYTWNGNALQEFDTDPTGVGAIFDYTAFAGGFFYFTPRSANDRELLRTDGSTVTKFDILPGTASSSPDFGTAVTLDDKFIFRATGPKGDELYRADAAGAQLIADINPNGNAFPLTSATPTLFKGELYFLASNPTVGAEIFKTDGTGVDLLADVAPGSAGFSSNFAQNIHLLNSDFFELLDASPKVNRFVSDGQSVWSLNAEVNAHFPGQSFAGLASFGAGLLYFSTTGQVFRITLVPEPTFMAIGCGTVIVASLSIVRRAISRRRPSTTQQLS
jgi:ELWxxDGT repeat protein